MVVSFAIVRNSDGSAVRAGVVAVLLLVSSSWPIISAASCAALFLSDAEKEEEAETLGEATGVSGSTFLAESTDLPGETLTAGGVTTGGVTAGVFAAGRLDGVSRLDGSTAEGVGTGAVVFGFGVAGGVFLTATAGRVCGSAGGCFCCEV